MLTLYYAPSTSALASHIALEQAGAVYEAVRLDFRAEAQRQPAYLAINPKGRVPALVTPRGTLTETPAILAFLAESFPAARLSPEGDPFAAAELQSFNSYLCSTVHVCHAHRMRGSRWADQEGSYADMRRKVPETMTACYEFIETRLFKGPWVLGANFSSADPYLFTLSCWLEGDSVDIRKFPRVAEHFERMKARASVQRALAAEAA